MALISERGRTSGDALISVHSNADRKEYIAIQNMRRRKHHVDHCFDYSRSNTQTQKKHLCQNHTLSDTVRGHV